MTELEQTETEFLANYNLRDYPAIGATVDLNVFTIHENQLKILLIQRGGHPEFGKWALPGGFVDVKESLDEAAKRELLEETKISCDFLEQLKTYGYPGRDKRGYIISTAYVAFVPNLDDPVAGDDASNAALVSVDEVLDDNFDLAFDHKMIIRDAVDRVRGKLEYAPIAHLFIGKDEFTLSDLRNIYEIVWGTKLIPSNFRRKVLSIENFVISTGKRRQSEIVGGRTADLYKFGGVEIIYPPFRKEDI